MSLAQDYCLRRSVFGKLLVDHPLHMQTLARMEVSGFINLFSLAELVKQARHEVSIH